MKIFNLKIVARFDTFNGKQGYKDKYFFKEYAAENDTHAYLQARWDYPLNKFDIFVESIREETSEEKREQWFQAMMQRTCYDCG